MLRKAFFTLSFSVFALPPFLHADTQNLSITLEGYDLSSPLAEETTENLTDSPEAPSFENWTISVHSSDPIELETEPPEDGTAPLPPQDELYKKMHQDAGQAVKIFLEQNSTSEIIKQIKWLTRLENVSLNQLNGSVHVHFLDDDDEKLVYLVEFAQRFDTKQPLWLAMKLPKNPEAPQLEQGFEIQRNLNQAHPGLTLLLGNVIKTKDFIAYFEEYSSGRKLASVMKRNRFNQEILKQTIQAVMEIYKTLGYVALDPGPKNMMLRETETSAPSIVAIELNQRDFRRPHQILRKLNEYYGQDISSGFFRKKTIHSKEIIFTEIMFTLGEKDGWRFLKRASKGLNEKLTEMQGQELDEDGKRMAGLVQELDHFLETYLKNLQPIP